MPPVACAHPTRRLEGTFAGPAEECFMVVCTACWATTTPQPTAEAALAILVQRACGTCTQGVMDAGNAHLHGRCQCPCHGATHWRR